MPDEDGMTTQPAGIERVRTMISDAINRQEMLHGPLPDGFVYYIEYRADNVPDYIGYGDLRNLLPEIAARFGYERDRLVAASGSHGRLFLVSRWKLSPPEDTPVTDPLLGVDALLDHLSWSTDQVAFQRLLGAAAWRRGFESFFTSLVSGETRAQSWAICQQFVAFNTASNVWWAMKPAGAVLGPYTTKLELSSAIETYWGQRPSTIRPLQGQYAPDRVSERARPELVWHRGADLDDFLETMQSRTWRAAYDAHWRLAFETPGGTWRLLAWTVCEQFIAFGVRSEGASLDTWYAMQPRGRVLGPEVSSEALVQRIEERWLIETRVLPARELEPGAYTRAAIPDASPEVPVMTNNTRTSLRGDVPQSSLVPVIGTPNLFFDRVRNAFFNTETDTWYPTLREAMLAIPSPESPTRLPGGRGFDL